MYNASGPTKVSTPEDSRYNAELHNFKTSLGLLLESNYISEEEHKKYYNCKVDRFNALGKEMFPESDQGLYKINNTPGRGDKYALPREDAIVVAKRVVEEYRLNPKSIRIDPYVRMKGEIHNLCEYIISLNIKIEDDTIQEIVDKHMKNHSYETPKKNKPEKKIQEVQQEEKAQEVQKEEKAKEVVQEVPKEGEKYKVIVPIFDTDSDDDTVDYSEDQELNKP